MRRTKPAERPLALAEIAARINAHLKRFEADKRINALYEPPGAQLSSYYHASAYQSGRYVGIIYVAFQGARALSRADAETYLKWLDAGNVGRHHKALEAHK